MLVFGIWMGLDCFTLVRILIKRWVGRSVEGPSKCLYPRCSQFTVIPAVQGSNDKSCDGGGSVGCGGVDSDEYYYSSGLLLYSSIQPFTHSVYCHPSNHPLCVFCVLCPEWMCAVTKLFSIPLYSSRDSLIIIIVITIFIIVNNIHTLSKHNFTFIDDTKTEKKTTEEFLLEK